MSVQPVLRVPGTAAHHVQYDQKAENHRADSNGNVKRREITNFRDNRVYRLVRPVPCKVSVNFKCRHSLQTGAHLLKKKFQSRTNIETCFCARTTAPKAQQRLKM